MKIFNANSLPQNLLPQNETQKFHSQSISNRPKLTVPLQNDDFSDSYFSKISLFQNRKKEIIKPIETRILKEEIASLTDSELLVGNNDFSVFISQAIKIPNILQEIARLRELTFRQVGEGTGKSLDIDRFDFYYLHLFLWDKINDKIVGAYRLGMTDLILQKYGYSGIYTGTLFDFKAEFFKRIGKAIELGRSFIVKEYQKKFSCLLMLWKGISKFIVQNPDYKILFGPVSISEEYSKTAKDLMIKYFNEKKFNLEYGNFVSPKNPYKFRKFRIFDRKFTDWNFSGVEELSAIISEIEGNTNGIPVLLRQYLKLNGSFTCFNVDKDFANCVDGLIVVDLTKTNPNFLSKLMGREGLKDFLDTHENAKELVY